MPADALTYSVCAKELNTRLHGARINKITMPQHDTLVFNLRSQGQNVLLTVSANASLPRVHLTTAVKENPPVAPSFLMHLRKHISGGFIEEVSIVPFERIIIFKIKALNELMINESKELIVEIMGKHSNIILVNQRGIISDSIKHITHDISAKRQVLPGLPYCHPPIQLQKITAFETEKLRLALQEFEGEGLEKYIQGKLSGLAASSIKEVIYRAKTRLLKNCDTQAYGKKLSEDEIDLLIKELNALYDLSKIKPCCLKKDESYLDFFITPYHSLCQNSDIDKRDVSAPSSELKFEYFDSLNQAMDAYYSSHFLRQVSVDKRSFLLAVIKSNINKSQKKLGTLMQKQHEALDYEDDRKTADLIISNLYKIRKGDSEIEVDDFFNDNKPIRINIDSHKSPQANAQIYYKKYNKKKTALQKLEPFIDELNVAIEQLEDLAYFVENAENELEFLELTDELVKLGYIKRKESNKKTDVSKKSEYYSLEYLGYKINIGKNSSSNEVLVKKSSSNSVWFHASNIPGSHVVIEHLLEIFPPNEVLVYAAEIAAYFSKARQSENVPVDYTLIKNVKKPKGAPQGKVIFTNQKTLYVTPKKPSELN